ncbi:MAG: hypothetical protein WBG92_16165 [Thiohalocapsa sp.]
MRIPGAIIPVAFSTAALLSCGPQQPHNDVDPTVGRACFEAHQASLPPVSQYEGIAEASENRITIRSRTGTEVETFICSLTPDGAAMAIGD